MPIKFIFKTIFIIHELFLYLQREKKRVQWLFLHIFFTQIFVVVKERSSVYNECRLITNAGLEA